MSAIKESIILKGILPATDVVFHTNIVRWIKKINSMQTWSPQKIQEWQTEQLQKLIHTTYSCSKYYKELFDSLNLKPQDIRRIEDLEKIPPLTKEIIRERFNDILLSNKEQYHYKLGRTGGSTGDPVKYIKDNKSWGFDNAFNIVMWKQTGYRYGDKFLALGSSSIFPVNKRSFLHELFYKMKGKLPFNAMNMSDNVLQTCVQKIIDNDIHYIYGYASSIFLLSEYVKKNKLEGKLHIKACFPTSEILTDIYRESIESAFHCQVVDSYGANDGGIVACNFGNGFKVGYNCIVQTDKTEHNNVSNLGSALLTDVTNTVFPFIRYRLGDVVEIGEGYNHFYNGQVLNKVIGRTSDIIELENGRFLTSPGFTILFKDLNVIGYRIYKSAPLEITVVIVKASNYTLQEEDLILRTMQKHAGDDCKIVIKYTDKIENRRNGKNLFFLNADSETNTAD